MKHIGLKQRAYDIIKLKILNLELSPGSRIREDMLAEEISMSRTPVREAMNQLVAEGFIKLIPRRGLFVIDLSIDEIRGLLDVRESLEKLALQKCIERINDQQVWELEQLINKFEQALEAENYEECNQLDSDFHVAISRVSGNKKLIDFIMEIEELMHIARNLDKKTAARDRSRLDALKQHKIILQYIRDRDIANAVKELGNNIKSMKEHLGI